MCSSRFWPSLETKDTPEEPSKQGASSSLQPFPRMRQRAPCSSFFPCPCLCRYMPAHPGTWARRMAFGIDLTKPGVEEDHFLCAGYYTCTEEGFGEFVRPRTHVYVATKLLYASGVPSDRRAPAYEPMLVSHVEATADGLSIHLFGKALLNWPRLKKYHGTHRLPSCLKHDPSLHVYSNWEFSATADSQEGFVGVRMGSPSAPPDVRSACEDTLGCVGYVQVYAQPLIHARTLHRCPSCPNSLPSACGVPISAGLFERRDGGPQDRGLHGLRRGAAPSPGRLLRRPGEPQRPRP